MKALGIGLALLLTWAAPLGAHRLDEYLQATIFTITRDHVEADTRLVPGVAVAARVVASIDTNGDGKLSEPERQAYALRVLSEQSLRIDGHPLAAKLVAAQFPSADEMLRGQGEIQLTFSADLPTGGSHRVLSFDNHHQSSMSAYLVNCLVPADRSLQISAQNRSPDQSLYQVEFEQSDTAAVVRPPAPVAWWHLSGFAGAFRLGYHHIAHGTDHLLFLLTLLLPAPLLARGSRWAARATLGHSLRQIVKVVTAFTLGHSLTLTLAAFGVAHAPARPLEVLIAVSILVSAVHAIRPLFPGREAAIAAFFGLIHGLAFATALGDLGFNRGYQLVSVLGFNIGIESMQLIVIAATMPSLLLFSRNARAYAPLRIVGAALAAVAALGWMVERLWDRPSVIDPVFLIAARHATGSAVVLFLVGMAAWLLSRHPANVGWTITTAPRGLNAPNSCQ